MLLIPCLADEELLASLEVICSMELVRYPVLVSLVEDGWYQPNYLFQLVPYLVSRPLANTTEVSITILTGGHIEETL